MNVRKFIGATSREALRLTREALGADAAILSNRTLNDGQVEIVALADAELAAAAGKEKAPAAAMPVMTAATLTTAAAAATATTNPYAGGGMPDVFSSRFGASVETSVPAAAQARTEAAASRTPEPWLVEQAKRLVQQRDNLMADAARPLQTPEWANGVVRNVVQDVVRRMPGESARPIKQDSEASGALAEQMRTDVERIVGATVTREITALRDMMEERFAGLMWNERQRRSPVCGELSRFLFAAGFSADLVRQLADNLPPAAASFDSALDWAQDTLSAHLPVLDSEDALMERGGIFALMGPTGVGKTTTTAKLAARCVMRFGAGKVALLTTDSYRIGGHEQLRIYGRILGVPVHAIKDGADLQLALNELRNKHIVLIDTIGMSQRDRAVSDHIAMLHGADLPVQRLLLLNATSHADTLNEVVRAYSSDDQPPLAGCVLTKLDEATHLGGALDTAIRYKLPVHYVSTGQKVPENLYVATRRFLLKSAFCVPRDSSPFVPAHDEMPGVLASLAARPAADQHGVRLG